MYIQFGGLQFLLELAGATMLLLYAVRMVRTGIERSYGASFQRILTRNDSAIAAAVSGAGLATILQSSAAVALLVSGFAASGVVSFPLGLAIVLGGDFGSALIVQALSFRIDWLAPLLLALGGWAIVKVEQRRTRQIGRILMGIALILISLEFLRHAMEPISDSAFLPAIASYLAGDYLTSFLVGAALAFVMHSSVAAVLICVTLVGIDTISLEAGVSLVLGANLGSALIPVWLTRGMELCARRIPYANLALRGSWALVALFLTNSVHILAVLEFLGPGQALVTLHLAFNLVLTFLALPFCKALEKIALRIMPEVSVRDPGAEKSFAHSALDDSVLDSPHRALASLKRELLRMSDVLDRMARPIMSVYEDGDVDGFPALPELENYINSTLHQIRVYVVAMLQFEMSKPQKRRTRELMEYAISLEAAGDIVSKRIMPLVREKARKRLQFSREGWRELVALHDRVLSNMALASNVLVSEDVESARQLIEEKADIARIELKSRRRHLKRLSSGEAVSLESSDIHLETLRSLRDFNSQISTIAYPILYQNGQLLETRLIETMGTTEI